MTNRIAAYGPLGPLYLLKTNVPDEWRVINGNWMLHRDAINRRDLNQYVLIKDNFGIYPYQQACDIIREMYEKSLPYKLLCTNNLSPFKHTCNKEEQTHKPFEVDYNEITEKLIEQKYPMENIMNDVIHTKIVTVATKHFVNNENVDDLTDDALLNSIVKLEESIENLTQVKTKSEYITKTIEAQKNTLAVIVKHLDARN